MRKFLLPLLILAACGSTETSGAAMQDGSIHVVIVNVRNQHSIDRDAVENVISPHITARYAEDTSFNVLFTEYVETAAPAAPWFTSFDDYITLQQRRLEWCRDYVVANLKIRPWIKHACVLPPMIDSEGNKWFGGIAYSPGSVSIVQCSYTSSHTPPRDRLVGCGIGIGHETGHNHNMSHLQSERTCIDGACTGGWGISMMAPDIGRHVDTVGVDIKFHEVSAVQMQDYYERSKRRRTRRIKRRCSKRLGNTRSHAVCKRRLDRHLRLYPTTGTVLMDMYR